MRSRSIIKLFQWVFAFVVILVCISFATMYFFSEKEKYDSMLVNVAERNQMLTQRVASMALLTNSDNPQVADTAKLEVRKAITLYLSSLQILKMGGKPTGFNNDSIQLPPSNDSTIIRKIAHIQRSFEVQKKIIYTLLGHERLVIDRNTGEIIISPAFDRSYKILQRRFTKGKLLKMNTELTQLFIAKAEANKRIFYVLITLVFIINLTIICIAFFMLFRSLNPLKKASIVIEEMSKGELPSELEINTTDEIGTILNSINTLSSNIRNASTFAHNVGIGIYDTQISIFGNRGILAESLKKMSNDISKATQEEKTRTWMANGLEAFANISREYTDVEILGHKTLTMLIKHIGAQQGTIYLKKEENNNTVLELISSYASPFALSERKIIQIGENNVGQCFVDKDTIILNDIPEDYISISSGLGSSPAGSVVLIPVINNNDTVEGVIEIASLEVTNESHIHFLEQVGKHLASIVSNLKANQRNVELLEQTKQATEALQAQEEELRQNLEELQATQEELHRKEIDYLAKINALEHNNH